MRGTIGVAGYDLSLEKGVLMQRHSRAVVRIGLVIAFLVDTYARIDPCSRLVVKWSIDVGTSIVDANYYEEMCIGLVNNSNYEFGVHKGD